MSRLYSTLTAAPYNIVGGISTVVGLGTALWPYWFRDKVGEEVPSLAIQIVGILLLGVSAFYFFLLWLLKPSENKGGEVGNAGFGANHDGGVLSHFMNAVPDKFIGIFAVTNLPRHMGGVDVIDLDGVATLRLRQPCSTSTVTLALDSVPLCKPDQISPGFQARDIQMHIMNEKEIFFSTEEGARRHTIEAGGRVFVVALREISSFDVEGVDNPLRFLFAVREK